MEKNYPTLVVCEIGTRKSFAVEIAGKSVASIQFTIAFGLCGHDDVTHTVRVFLLVCFCVFVIECMFWVVPESVVGSHRISFVIENTAVIEVR